MRIGELAERTGTTTTALRYYERVGILPPADRSRSGYRRYADEAVDRVQFVKAAQPLGLTLEEIRDILQRRDSGEAPCGHVLDLIRQHLRLVESRITDLQRLHTGLAELEGRAGDLVPEDCSPGAVCHVIPRS